MIKSLWKKWRGLSVGIAKRKRGASSRDQLPALLELESRINPSLTMLGDLNPNGMGSSIRNITPVGDLVYFTADDGIHGRELWKSDGTAEGTVLVKDIIPGAEGSNPVELTLVNSALFLLQKVQIILGVICGNQMVQVLGLFK